MDENAIRPLILLGAARSGTKALRDSLSLASGVPAVPYDIGYVWRYGNERDTSDAQQPAQATPRVRRFVRRFLGRYAAPDGRVIEKTVGNTLRAPFVAELLPEAVFVHLVRDGVDVAESARREWQAETDWRYLMRKARHFPHRLIPSYGRKFLVSRTIGRRRASTRRPTWGPRYPGIDADVSTEPLLVVTARQWRACVVAAQRDVRELSNVIDVRYEDLIADPETTLTAILAAAGWPTARAEAGAATIRSGRAGHGRTSLTAEERAVLDVEIGPLLEELGYERP